MLVRRVAKRVVRGPIVTDVQFRLGRWLGRRRGCSHIRQIYSIGVASGVGLMPLRIAAGDIRPVIDASMVSDMDAGFVADPFWLCHGGQWWMFFEVWNNHAHKGEIGCARSSDGRSWSYVGRALREPFHLSYPYVIRHEGEIYMVPETQMSGSVRIYRAEEFPLRWRLAGTLVREAYCDPTVFHLHGLWWMLVGKSNGLADDELHLYWARSLLGDWKLHPRGPLIKGDPTQARPAGRVLVSGELAVRFAQTARPVYGSGVRASRITKLTPDDYSEEPFSPGLLLAGSGTGWNADGMHHIDLLPSPSGEWSACVDGWRWGPGGSHRA